MRIHIVIFVICCICFFISTACNERQEIIYSENITDKINLLSNEKTAKLNNLVSRCNKQLNITVMVVIKDSLESETIENDTEKVYHQSVLSQSFSQKWVLIVICFKNRKIRIHFGKALQDKLSDEVCAMILQGDILPLFKQKKYYEGLEKGVETIANLIKSK